MHRQVSSSVDLIGIHRQNKLIVEAAPVIIGASYCRFAGRSAFKWLHQL
jgi:hypothetical protein